VKVQNPSHGEFGFRTPPAGRLRRGKLTLAITLCHPEHVNVAALAVALHFNWNCLDRAQTLFWRGSGLATTSSS
jgi:hypothetical protein